MKVGSKVPERTRAAILADHVAGVPHMKIAEKYGCTDRTVRRIVKNIRDTVPAACTLRERVGDVKERLNSKAISAIESGLDDPTDSYKRGNLGVQVLKGTGVLQPENAITINQLIAACPNDWRERYGLTTEPKD